MLWCERWAWRWRLGCGCGCNCSAGSGDGVVVVVVVLDDDDGKEAERTGVGRRDVWSTRGGIGDEGWMGGMVRWRGRCVSGWGRSGERPEAGAGGEERGLAVDPREWFQVLREGRQLSLLGEAARSERHTSIVEVVYPYSLRKGGR